MPTGVADTDYEQVEQAGVESGLVPPELVMLREAAARMVGTNPGPRFPIETWSVEPVHDFDFLNRAAADPPPDEPFTRATDQDQ